MKRKRTAREMAGREGSGEELDDDNVVERSEVKRVVTMISVLEKYTKQNYLSPLEVREHMRELWVNQRTIIRALWGVLVTLEKEDWLRVCYRRLRGESARI